MASAFEQFASDDRFRVIAAGVSNSGEKDPLAFQRERDLVEALPQQGGCVVYLSTCSVFDPTLVRSPYVLHKMAMESMVHSTFAGAIVLRLPNMLGRSRNNNTLLNHFRACILSGSPVVIQRKACRFVMDCRSIALYAPLLLSDPVLRGQTINLCYDVPVPVPDLFSILASVHDVEAEVRYADEGACYQVDNGSFRRFLADHGFQQPDAQALRESIAAYYGPGTGNWSDPTTSGASRIRH